MSRSHLGMCCAAIILLAARAALSAQTLPAFDKFDGDLRACAAGEKIALTPDLSASIRKIYDEQGAQGTSSFADSTKFLSRIQEKDRFEAYRLYAECIAKVLPNTTISPLPTTVTYRVCSGEYEKSCQKHDAYLYCGDDVAAWAKLRCTSSTIQRLGAYGGNKCGYAIDAVICAGPRPVPPEVQQRRPPQGSRSRQGVQGGRDAGGVRISAGPRQARPAVHYRHRLPGCRIRHGVRICAGPRQLHPGGHHRRGPQGCRIRYGVHGERYVCGVRE